MAIAGLASDKVHLEIEAEAVLGTEQERNGRKSFRRACGRAAGRVREGLFGRPGVEPAGRADLPRGDYWSPKNRRTRADLRAATRRNGSENTT